MGRGDGMDDDRAVVDVVYSDTDSDDCEGGV